MMKMTNVEHHRLAKGGNFVIVKPQKMMRNMKDSFVFCSFLRAALTPHRRRLACRLVSVCKT